MPSWNDFEAAAPELAAKVRSHLDAHTHKTLATLRHDGSPRISGTECQFADGELYVGSMWRAVKALDLRRDGRYALHSGSDDPPEWSGDAKVAGVAEEVLDEALVRERNGEAAANGPSHLFRLGVAEASVVRLNEARTAIVIEWWTSEAGVRTLERG